jgi:hypothetical protein
MDGTGNHHGKRNKTDSEREVPPVFSPMCKLDLKGEKELENKRGTTGG